MALSLYPLSFFANTPFKQHNLNPIFQGQLIEKHETDNFDSLGAGMVEKKPKKG